jgi:tRNA-dihydrouridine synthase A
VVEADAALRSGAHGVMLGRAVYYNPWHILGHVDTVVYGSPSSGITRRQVLEKYKLYGESVLGKYGKGRPNLRDIVRPLINLFHSESGNGQWKRRTDAALLHCTVSDFTDTLLFYLLSNSCHRVNSLLMLCRPYNHS